MNVSTKIQPIVHQVALQVKSVDCGELIRTLANCLAGWRVVKFDVAIESLSTRYELWAGLKR